MNKRELIRGTLLSILILTLLIFVVSCTKNSAPTTTLIEKDSSKTEKLTLNAATFLGPPTVEYEAFEIVLKALEKEMSDEIKINFVGGPDAIPPTQLGEALETGVVDFAFHALTWFEGSYPEAILGALVEISPAEARKRGVDKFINEAFDAGGSNVVYLGTNGMLYPNILYTTFQVEKIEDLRGKLVRTSPTHNLAAKALKMSPVSMPGGEIYGALERGVVDAVFWPGFVDGIQLHEVVKYKLEPGWGNQAGGNFINKDTLNKMSEPVREKFIATVQAAVDDFHNNVYPRRVKEYNEVLEKAGVETIVLPEEFRLIQLEAYKNNAIEKFGKKGEQFIKMIGQ